MPFPRSAGGAPPMAPQENIDRIAQMAERTEDVAQLRQYRQELLSIAANMATVIAQTSDSGVQEHAGEIKQSAEYGADEIGERARQLEIDQMDPDYERQKDERATFAEHEEQRQAQEAREGMKKLQGLLGGLGGGGGAGGGGAGLGGLLGGLFGSKGGQQEAEAAAGTVPGPRRPRPPRSPRPSRPPPPPRSPPRSRLRSRAGTAPPRRWPARAAGPRSRWGRSSVRSAGPRTPP